MTNWFERNILGKKETVSEGAKSNLKAEVKKAQDKTEPAKIVENYFQQEDAQKKMAKTTESTDIRIKDLRKDVPTLAAIEFLGESSPAWAKRFGDLSSIENSTISAENLNMVKTWMSNPDNRFENGKWISGSVEQATEKRKAKETKEANAAKLMTEKVTAAEKFFAETLPDTAGNWSKMLGSMSPDEKKEFFAKFAKDPEVIIKSASYDKKKKEFTFEGGTLEVKL